MFFIHADVHREQLYLRSKAAVTFLCTEHLHVINTRSFICVFTCADDHNEEAHSANSKSLYAHISVPANMYTNIA